MTAQPVSLPDPPAPRPNLVPLVAVYDAADHAHRRDRRRAHTVRSLTRLLDVRDDLAGVSPVADVMTEATLWSV